MYHSIFELLILEVDLQPHVVPLGCATESILVVPELLQFGGQALDIDPDGPLLRFLVGTDTPAKGIVVDRSLGHGIVQVDI
jgi:hypothetical protein